MYIILSLYYFTFINKDNHYVLVLYNKVVLLMRVWLIPRGYDKHIGLQWNGIRIDL